jgi:FG-GAP repeat
MIWEDEGLLGGIVVPARHRLKLESLPSSRTRRVMLSFFITAVVALTCAASASAAFVQQGEKLTGEGEVGRAGAGESVALSADGNAALIGGPCDGETSSKGPCVGAAWVFTRTGSTWTQQRKLTGAGEIGSGQFGAAVALSADGNTALIGGEKDRRGVGAAWIFSRTGTTWTQQVKLTQGATHSPRRVAFGSSVALSGDGNTALIGGYFDRHGRGAAWVFTRTASVWTQQGSKLTASDEEGLGAFAASVALSADGDTALIGGPGPGYRPSRGAAWVFTRAGGAWSQQGGKLTGRCQAVQGDFARGFFGASVALSADGDTALVGEPFCDTRGCGEDPHCALSGRAYAFTRSGSAWTQAKSLPPQESRGSGFGASLALSADGNTALIGEPGECFEGFVCNPGEAWAFTRSGETWTQQGEKITGSGEVEGKYSNSVRFGWSVALSSDARTALIGGPGDNGYVGAAWVFVQ